MCRTLMPSWNQRRRMQPEAPRSALVVSPRAKRARPGLGATAFVLVPAWAADRKGDQTQLRDDVGLGADTKLASSAVGIGSVFGGPRAGLRRDGRIRLVGWTLRWMLTIYPRSSRWGPEGFAVPRERDGVTVERRSRSLRAGSAQRDLAACVQRRIRSLRWAFEAGSNLELPVSSVVPMAWPGRLGSTGLGGNQASSGVPCGRGRVVCTRWSPLRASGSPRSQVLSASPVARRRSRRAASTRRSTSRWRRSM